MVRDRIFDYTQMGVVLLCAIGALAIGRTYQNARTLTGRVVSEKFVRGHSGGFLSPNEPHKYCMNLRSLDEEYGKLFSFKYEGIRAIEIDSKYDVGSIVKWREKFKPR